METTPLNDRQWGRQRSPRRLRHEAEIEVFKSKAGDLDQIRESLGLRPSQICEILKVHPSAWTRWVRTRKAPPHIYQMLEWYVELQKWRGQNHPLYSKEFSPVTVQKKITQQSPEIYIPAEENPNKYIDKQISYIRNQKFIEKNAFITILSVCFTIQLGLMVAMYIWLKK